MLHKWYEKIHSGLDWLNASMIVSVWELYISVEQQPTFFETIAWDFCLVMTDSRRFPTIFRRLPNITESIRRYSTTFEYFRSYLKAKMLTCFDTVRTQNHHKETIVKRIITSVKRGYEMAV